MIELSLILNVSISSWKCKLHTDYSIVLYNAPSCCKLDKNGESIQKVYYLIDQEVQEKIELKEMIVLFH